MRTGCDKSYLDESLPRDVRATPPRGSWHEAEVPDTPDLVDHAHLAIRALTSLVDAEWDYEQYSIVYASNPPIFELGHGGLLALNPKWAEALPMLRAMTGSTENIEIDGRIMASILHMTGQDGLCYQPIEDRPWAFFDDTTRQIGEPYADTFAESRQILAYIAWYQHDANPLWPALIQRKVQTLRDMVLRKYDTTFFRLSRGYTPWDCDRRSGPVVPLGDHKLYDASRGMVGTPAAAMTAMFGQTAANWYRLTGDQEIIDLANGLVRYLQRSGQLIDKKTGRILVDHITHVTHSLLSTLAYALVVEDTDMAAWVQRGFECLTTVRDPSKTGVIFDLEACAVGDILGLAIMLSRAGLGDYWDDVDRWLRNTFLDLQVAAVDFIKNRPLEQKPLKDDQRQFEDGAERCLGVWRYALEPHRTMSVGCCNGNCSRMLYYIWDSIVMADRHGLRVNLLFNRASPWADVDSHLPYQGKLEVRMKSEQPEVQVRIPDWVERNFLRCSVNDEERPCLWSGSYMRTGPVQPGDTLTVLFPVRHTMIPEHKINNWVAVRGNTVVEHIAYPLNSHEDYRAEKAPMKKVKQFISQEHFIW